MPLLTLKLLLAWLWFYVLLLSYFILKPLRDGIGSILSKDSDFWYLSTFISIVLAMVVSRQDKYVSKGFIDTVVFRFSDVLASSRCSQINLTGMTLGNLSLCLLPVLMVWFALSQRLGREFREINRKKF